MIDMLNIERRKFNKMFTKLKFNINSVYQHSQVCYFLRTRSCVQSNKDTSWLCKIQSDLITIFFIVWKNHDCHLCAMCNLQIWTKHL